jgi:uncharacterized protein YggT (Ycf19 family)
MASEVVQPAVPVVVESTPVIASTALVTEPATHNYRAVQVIWFVTSVVTTLIAIRFVLKLLSANPDSGFVSLIYGLSDALVSPFRAIFSTAGSTATVDIAALVGIVVYALVGWGLVSVVKLMTAPRGARSIS